MAWQARKAMLVLGVKYGPGDEVPLSEINPGLAKKLIEQRRVVPRADDAGPGSSEKPKTAPKPKSKTTAKKKS
jgi:hypothetical protein